MSKKQMTLVYYYIPEDCDNQETPNVFGVMVSKNNIRLHHLYQHFPLKGSYVFRFKVMYDNTIAWLDLPDLDTKLPTFKDKIMVKVNRISWQTNQSYLYGHYRIVKKDQNVINTQQQPIRQNPQPQPIKVQKKQSVNVPSKADHMDLLGEKHQTFTSPRQNIIGAKIQTSDLLSSKHEPVTNINVGQLPQDFNFDLLSPQSTNVSKTSNSGQIGLENLLI